MGGLCSREHTATSELYIDRAVKYVTGFLQLLLGFIAVIVVHLVDKVECYYKGDRVNADEYCWTHITADSLKNPPPTTSSDTGPALPHKIFPAFIVCQAASVLIVLVVWYWCFGQDLANHVQEILHHVNNLTSHYKRYSDALARGGGGQREITEETLHTELDNYLEYLVYLLTTKVQRFYLRHLLKWSVVFLVSFVWFLGILCMFIPLDFAIFPDKATCTKNSATYTCVLPSSLFLTVLWALTLIILVATMALVVFHFAYDLCRRRDYQDTFFYRAVPGAMDNRLTRIVESTYNPRFVWLLSRQCWENSSLCTSPGLSKSLARRYCYVSSHHRKDRWRDQHFPTLRSDQVDKFRFNADSFVESGAQDDDVGCWDKLLWCGLDKYPLSPRSTGEVHNRDQRRPNKRRKKRTAAERTSKARVGAAPDTGDGNSSSGYSSGLRPSFHPALEDGYMTPNLFVRKLAKESQTPEQMLDEQQEAARHKREGHRLTPRDDAAITLQQRYPSRELLGLSRDDTEVDYGAFYAPHDRDPDRMQREYDPLTYGVRMSVKKEMAKDVKAWRP